MCQGEPGTVMYVSRSAWYSNVCVSVSLVQECMCPSQHGTVMNVPRSAWYSKMINIAFD